MSKPMEDPFPGIIAAFDQAKKNAPIMAGYLRTVYEALKNEGFSDDQALRLTIEQWRIAVDDS